MSDEFTRFREPSPEEHTLLERLGNRATDLPPNWMNGLLVADMADGGMGSLKLRPRGAEARGRRFGRVAAEYRYQDVDRVDVLVALYLDDIGQPLELDVWKVDFSPVVWKGGSR